MTYTHNLWQTFRMCFRSGIISQAAHTRVILRKITRSSPTNGPVSTKLAHILKNCSRWGCCTEHCLPDDKSFALFLFFNWFLKWISWIHTICVIIFILLHFLYFTAYRFPIISLSFQLCTLSYFKLLVNQLQVVLFGAWLTYQEPHPIRKWTPHPRPRSHHLVLRSH